MKSLKRTLLALTLLSSVVITTTAKADETSRQCETVTFGAVEWTDLQVTTTIAQTLLERLGYKVSTVTDSVEATYQHLADKKADAFLGNWVPSNSEAIAPYLGRRELEVLETNLNGAQYTLAVPKYVYDQGVTTVADIAKHADKFGNRIYGLEKGNSGNHHVQTMIDTNDFGLGDFTLMETSERIMLAQVKGKTRKGEWIAFLAWTPHPMNLNYDIAYLDGADKYFGPNKGEQHVRTIVRSGLKEECPNVTRLLSNLTFSMDMQQIMMDQVLNGFVPTDRAVRMWLNENEEQLDYWLQGVTTIDGQTPDSAAMANALKVGWGRQED